MKYEKMSKSRGNVISVDEVIFGVYHVEPNYEFIDLQQYPVDYKKVHL